MPDNVPITPGSGTNVATRSVTYSGDTAHAEAVGIVIFAGADDAKTATDVGGFTETGTSALTGIAVTGATPHDSVDSGNPLKLGGKATSAAPTAVAAADRVNAFFDLQGRLVVASKAATGTGSNVASSATSVTLLALNADRLGFTIYNDSTAVLYVKLGTTASATDFVVKMASGGYYEGPFGYTGRIDGIWASANGNARIVELT